MISTEQAVFDLAEDVPDLLPGIGAHEQVQAQRTRPPGSTATRAITTLARALGSLRLVHPRNHGLEKTDGKVALGLAGLDHQTGRVQRRLVG